MSTTLLTLREFSLSYKLLSFADQIHRVNVIQDIELLADEGHKLIIIEGNEGIGKSSTLMQYSEKHCNNSFTYFINPSSKITYKQDYLMEDLGRQIYFYNTDEIPSEDMVIDEGSFYTLIFNLLKKPIKKNTKFFFIIDGLDQIETVDVELLIHILEYLPFDTKNFHFIISGDSAKLLKILPPKAVKTFKPYRIPSFTLDEVATFFDWQRNDEYVKEFATTWKGHPETLSQVKRILANGISIEDFLSRDDIKEKNDLLEIEWQQTKIDHKTYENDLVRAISIITFDDSVKDVRIMASFLGCDFDELITQINSISFLIIKENQLSFVSRSYHQYSLQKLKRFESITWRTLIAYYTDKNDANSVVNLPGLLSKNKDFSAILKILTVPNLIIILNNSKSFAEIRKQLNYGYKASTSLTKAYEEIFKFSVLRSTIAGLQVSDARESKIKAYVALKKYEDAFAIISKAVLKEDKVAMLIIYAKELKLQAKIKIEDVYIKEIESLLNDADQGFLKQNLIEIVTDLAYFSPDMAIRTLKANSGLKNNNSIEWLIGYISAIGKYSENQFNSETVKIEPQSKVKAEINFLEDLLNSVGVALLNVHSGEIIEEIKKISNVSESIFQLKSWIKKNKTPANAFEIVNFALDLIIKHSSDIKPTTTTILDVIEPAICITDILKLKEIVTKIDTLLITVSTPTIDKYRVEFLLMNCFFNLDQNEGNQRAFSVFESIYSIKDYVVRIEVLSYALNLISEIILNADENQFIFKLSEIKKEILTQLQIFLNETADQHDIIKDTLDILSGHDFLFALEIADRLNTEERRQKGKLTCLLSTIKNPISKWSIDLIKKVLNEFRPFTNIYSRAVVQIFEQCYKRSAFLSFSEKQLISQLLPYINDTKGNVIKCNILSKCICIFSSESESSGEVILSFDKLVNRLLGFLKIHWAGISEPISKIGSGYSIISRFADLKEEYSQHYISEIETLNLELNIDNEFHSVIFKDAIKIAIKIYGGLIKVDKNYSYSAIEKHINNIPSIDDQLMLWSELAIRCHIAGAVEKLEEIVANKIIVVLEKYSHDSDQHFYYFLLSICASSIALAQKDHLLSILRKVPQNELEDILSRVFFVLLSNRYDEDEFSGYYGRKEFNYQKAVNYISFMEFIRTDSAFYVHLKNLANLLKNNPNVVSREQKSALKERLRLLIEAKLPNQSIGIKHGGYLILAKAFLLSFDINNNGHDQVFDALDNETSAVPNISDRAFIYLRLGAECNNKKKKHELLTKAFDEADKIESIAERISCYQDIIHEGERMPSFVQSKINKILSEIYKLEDEDAIPTFRTLIDFVYKDDKSMAQKIVASTDTDPSRELFKEPLSNHYDQLEQENLVSDDYSNFGKIRDRRVMGKIVKKLQGQLNSRTRNSRSIDQTINILHTASKLPFQDSIPLFEFFVENYIQSDNIQKSTIVSFYDSACANANLCYNFICNINNRNVSNLYVDPMADNTYFARPGFRNEALLFLKRHSKNSNSKCIYLLDPFLSIKDIELVKDLLEWCPQCEITLLTSSQAQGEISRSSFIDAWRNISEENTPNLSVIKTWISDNNLSPFHDRWILFYDKMQGVRSGNSFNSLGIKKVSELSFMQSTEEIHMLVNEVVNPFIKLRLGNVNQQKIKYDAFDL